MIFRVLTAAGLILAIVAASFLIARPFKRDTVKDTVNRRDVFLCVDLSSSNYEGVQNLVQAFRDTVTGLDGDRIGISLFNTSSIQFVPMTDDYDFVLRRLDSLERYLAAQEEFETSFAQKYDSVYDIPDSERARYEELNRILASFDEGLTAGYEMKGTSAIGEGLASCLFSFPELNEEERTRIIIFVTDNKPELLGNPLVTLTDAAGMCAFDKVTVFGIDPANPESDNAEAGASEMQEAVESTGGKFYGQVLLPVSKASYGIYLCHLLLLSVISGWIRGSLGLGADGVLGIWTTPVQIFAIAFLSFAGAALFSVLVQKIPKVGKWVIG